MIRTNSRRIAMGATALCFTGAVAVGATALSESASAAASTSPAPEPAKSRFHDVREDRDRILTGVGDISQIPIGMGGSGLP